MIGYLDLASGLSGDMLLGCLVDAGWSLERLRQTVDSLALPSSEWAVQSEQVLKGALRATRVDVIAEEGRQRRQLSDIIRIIDSSQLAAIVKQRSISVFRRLAEAEARVHGTSPDEVHFHEVGAVDAMIDIVGSISGLCELGIEKLYASPVPLGHGWTEGAHGRLPLPAPATLQILSVVGAPTRPAPGAGELLTPTGAAILAEMAEFQQPTMTLLRVGVGAGQKNFAWPNIARLWLGEAEVTGPIVQLETNIDDMNPQLYEAVFEELFAVGARDVWLTPIQMKKNRPAITLSVLGRAVDELALTHVLLRHTTTLGVRAQRLTHRHEVRREMRDVATAHGVVQAKVKWIGSEAVGAMPEYEDCRRLAVAVGQPLKVVYDAAVVAAHALLAALKTADGVPSIIGGSPDVGTPSVTVSVQSPQVS